jgi:alkylation response protein AidB-like acyl-CoA dehydrogenase
MNFGFTEEQELLRQEVRKFLDAHAPLDEVRKLAETPEGFSRELWKQIGELGWIGLTIPEAYGGAGLGWVDLTVVLEEMGRTLFPSPYLATTLAAAAIAEAGSEVQRKRWLPALADGSKIATLAIAEAGDRAAPDGIQLTSTPAADSFALSGEKIQVLDGAAADLLVVAFRSGRGASDLSLAVLERDVPGVAVENTPCIDATKRVARVRLDSARVARADVLSGAPAWPALARTLDRAAAAATAEMVGAAEAALYLTVGYSRQREQFGSPIGRFQGVKHPLAEIYVDVESFKSLLYYAAWCLDTGNADAPRFVSLAKAYASEAFARIGIDAVGLHGGIGYTWEYDAQLYLKRSKWSRPLFGDADFHYDRVAAGWREGGA